MEARAEYEESIADLLGPCSEVLLDLEGRQISPDWLDVPERVVLALLRLGIVPGEDRHLLFRVPNPFIEQDEEKVSKILASVARANVLFHLACERVGVVPKQNAIHEITVPQVNSTAEIGAVVKVGTLYLQAVAGLFDGPSADAFLAKRVPKARRAELLARVARVRLVPLCENVGALAHLPDLLEAFYFALERGIGVADLPTPGIFRTSFDRPEAIVRVFVAMSDTAEQSGKIATDTAYTLALAGREEAERRLAVHARRHSEPAPSVTFLIGAGRAGFRGGFDPAHPGVLRQFARADGVTLQGIRADAPEEAARLAAAFRAEVAAKDRGPALPAADADSLMKLLEAGVKAHTETLLRIAPLLAPFGSLVPQTRVRIRATGSVNYGRSIPVYPEEWGGGTVLPDNRDLRDAWPEGVTLPRAIVYNLACTTLGLPAVTSDLGVLDRRAAVLLDRHAPGYREIVASELPCFVKEAAGLVFGRKLAETAARKCQRAAAALWVDARAHEELIAPTCLFAMEYLRYLAEDSESWDETKEHESQTTREEELIRETSSVAFVALCSERPGDRWPILQTLVDAEDASRLLLARELTLEEKREFVDLRIEGWLRTLAETLAPELRREWSRLRELPKDELTLDAIQRLIDLEKLRGSRGRGHREDRVFRRWRRSDPAGARPASERGRVAAGAERAGPAPDVAVGVVDVVVLAQLVRALELDLLPVEPAAVALRPQRVHDGQVVRRHVLHDRPVGARGRLAEVEQLGLLLHHLVEGGLDVVLELRARAAAGDLGAGRQGAAGRRRRRVAAGEGKHRGSAGDHVGPADLVPGRQHLVLLAVLVRVLDRELLAVVGGAEALAIEDPDQADVVAGQVEDRLPLEVLGALALEGLDRVDDLGVEARALAAAGGVLDPERQPLAARRERRVRRRSGHGGGCRHDGDGGRGVLPATPAPGQGQRHQHPGGDPAQVGREETSSNHHTPCGEPGIVSRVTDPITHGCVL